MRSLRQHFARSVAILVLGTSLCVSAPVCASSASPYPWLDVTPQQAIQDVRKLEHDPNLRLQMISTPSVQDGIPSPADAKYVIYSSSYEYQVGLLFPDITKLRLDVGAQPRPKDQASAAQIDAGVPEPVTADEAAAIANSFAAVPAVNTTVLRIPSHSSMSEPLPSP